VSWSTRLRYRFGDIDDAGIAYYPKLLHYFHQAFEDWWSDALDHPYPKLLHEDRLGFPAVKIEAEFFAPIAYGDEPDVHLGVLAMGESSVTFGFWMMVGEEPRPRCRARITTAAVHMTARTKLALPDDWRERFAAYAIEEADYPAGR
jgi:4-hydroxybenzoyl-CoA thioesterase